MAPLRRRDGESVYRDPQRERYSTVAVTGAETFLLETADVADAPTCSRAAVKARAGAAWNSGRPGRRGRADPVRSGADHGADRPGRHRQDPHPASGFSDRADVADGTAADPWVAELVEHVNTIEGARVHRG